MIPSNLLPPSTIHILIFSVFPIPTPYELSKSRQSKPYNLLMLYLGFCEKFSKAFHSWNLCTQYRDTCDSSSWKRATLNPSQVLNEVYITLIVMPHPWKLTKTISKTVSDKDLYIHYQLHPDLFHYNLAIPTGALAIIQLCHCISELPAGPLYQLKLHLLSGRSTVSPSPCPLFSAQKTECDVLSQKKKRERWGKKILK